MQGFLLFWLCSLADRVLAQCITDEDLIAKAKQSYRMFKSSHEPIHTILQFAQSLLSSDDESENRQGFFVVTGRVWGVDPTRQANDEERNCYYHILKAAADKGFTNDDFIAPEPEIKPSWLGHQRYLATAFQVIADESEVLEPYLAMNAIVETAYAIKYNKLERLKGVFSAQIIDNFAKDQCIPLTLKAKILQHLQELPCDNPTRILFVIWSLLNNDNDKGKSIDYQKTFVRAINTLKTYEQLREFYDILKDPHNYAHKLFTKKDDGNDSLKYKYFELWAKYIQIPDDERKHLSSLKLLEAQYYFNPSDTYEFLRLLLTIPQEHRQIVFSEISDFLRPFLVEKKIWLNLFKRLLTIPLEELLFCLGFIKTDIVSANTQFKVDLSNLIVQTL